MFNNLTEIKDFITWCHQNGVKQVSVGTVSFELHDQQLANLEDLSMSIPDSKVLNSEALVDTEKLSKEEEDDLLFWSSRS